VTAVEDLLVVHGPERLHDIAVHQDEPGELAVIETVTVRPTRVFERREDGSLVELHGAAKEHALRSFWDDVERFNQQQENDA
jgi:hypothetical protein